MNCTSHTNVITYVCILLNVVLKLYKFRILAAFIVLHRKISIGCWVNFRAYSLTKHKPCTVNCIQKCVPIIGVCVPFSGVLDQKEGLPFAHRRTSHVQQWWPFLYCSCPQSTGWYWHMSNMARISPLSESTVFVALKFLLKKIVTCKFKS